MNNLIFFDLEGPLSPQDNAYELMKLFPNGDKIFEIMSRYDDLLTLKGRENYEPGDTLALIAPFLICHDISEKEIMSLATKAGLVNGAQELVSKLKNRNWEVFCISTSYEQYASIISERVGISQKNLASTKFAIDEYRFRFGKEDFTQVRQIEREILSLQPLRDDKKIKEVLDNFFWKELPKTKLGVVLREVKPMGGRRKVKALQDFAIKEGKSLNEVVVVGDSITDFRMLEVVSEAGGLAVAFNANEYALPYATVGLASTNLSDLESLLEARERGLAEEFVKTNRKFQWLFHQENIEEPLKIHKRFRLLVREEAGRLG